MICFHDFAPLKRLVVKFEADEYLKELPIFINQTKSKGILILCFLKQSNFKIFDPVVNHKYFKADCFHKRFL